MSNTSFFQKPFTLAAHSFATEALAFFRKGDDKRSMYITAFAVFLTAHQDVWINISDWPTKTAAGQALAEAWIASSDYLAADARIAELRAAN